MADQEKEILIKISAKNLAADEFAKARRDIAGLSDETAKANKAVKDGDFSWKSLGATIGVVGAAAIAAVGAATAVVVGLTAKIIELGKHGSDVADIRKEFDTLSKSLGLDSKQSIETLSKAVDGVVSKFDLMKATNKALSAGLQLTNKDFTTLGEGARVLSDRIGGDTKGAYEALTEALATGKTARLAQIGLNIDEAQAIRDHAAALGVDTDQFNEHGKRIALQAAVMRELTGVVKESGRAQLDFADTFDVAKVKFRDLVDDLAVGIANSKVLGEMLGGLGATFGDVFGDDLSGLIEDVVDWIEIGALHLVEWGRTAVSFGSVAARVFGGVLTVLGTVGTTLSGIFTGMAVGIAKMLELASQIPGVGRHLEGAAQQARTVAEGFKLLTSDLASGTKAGFEMAKGNGALFDTLRKLDAGLVSTRDRMVNAMAATDDHTAATESNAGAVRRRADVSSQLIGGLNAEGAAWEALTKKNRETMKAAEEAIEQGMRHARIQRSNLLLQSRPLELPAIGLAPTVASQAVASQFRPPILAGFRDLFQNDVPNTILAALTGGGNPIASVGSLMGGKLGENFTAKFGTTITSALGQTFGGAINTLLPGVGSLLGPLLGKVGGFFKNIFGGGEKKEVEKLRGQFLEAAGGIEELRKKADGAGISLDRLLRAKKVKDFENAVRELNGAFDDQAEKEAKLNAAIEKYGFSIDELGPKFRAQRLAELAAGLKDEFDILIESGIDMDVVIKRMGGAMNEYVQTVVKAGGEVPANMKGILDRMIELGQLTDENGNKITSIEGSGIKFAETMSEVGDRIVSAMQDVAAAIRGDVGGALASLPRDIGIRIHGDVDQGSFDIPGSGDIPGHAAGGVFSHPHKAWIAEGGRPEIVGDEQFMTRVLEKALVRLQANGSTDAKASGGNVINFNLSTPLATIDTVRQAVYNEIGPVFLDWLERNQGGSRTRLQQIVRTA